MLRTLGILLIAALLSPAPAYAIGSEQAREWLRGKDVPYTAKEFVIRAGRGDIEVVSLFLDAGMDPDAKDEGGRTALQAAIEKSHGEAMKVLIDGGAGLEPLISLAGGADKLLQDAKSQKYIDTVHEKGKTGRVRVLSPGAYKVEREGSFGGLGIVIGLDENRALSVVAPIEGTPASRAGIRAGDKIIEIDGESAEGIRLEAAVEKLRGLKGSKVDITVKRPGSDGGEAEETLRFTLIRDRITVPTVVGKMLDDGIGYVSMNEFSGRSADDFRELAKKLNSEGMRSLVLDLRNNPGGLIRVAADVADEFIKKGRLIYATQSTHPGLSVEFRAEREASLHFETPIVVLVNRGTGGASQLVAGALRDSRFAAIIGERTSGAALVENTIPLSDGSAINLPFAELLTPKRAAINGIGLAPDITVKADRSRVHVHRVSDEDFQHFDKREAHELGMYDTQLRLAEAFLQDYDSSETLERNIALMKKRIATQPEKDANKKILRGESHGDDFPDASAPIQLKFPVDETEAPRPEDNQLKK